MKIQLIPSLVILFASGAALCSCSISGRDISNAANNVFSNGYSSDPKAAIISKTINIVDINELDTSSGLKVTYIVGSANEAVINAPSDLMDKIEVKQDDGELSFGLNQNVRSGLERVTITVTAPSIVSFDASSGSAIILPDNFTSNSGELSLEASSAASITGKNLTTTLLGAQSSSGASISISVTAETTVCKASSGASITISGKTTSTDFKASSGASINANSFSASTGTAHASSGASVHCSIQSPTLLKESSGGSVSNN